MKNNEDRLPIAAGGLPIADAAPMWFSIYVKGSRIHFELTNIEADTVELTLSNDAPIYLLDAIRKAGYTLPEPSVDAVERFAVCGSLILEAMHDSMKADLNKIATLQFPERLRSDWLDNPDGTLWKLVKLFAPNDIQMAIFQMMQPFTFVFDEKVQQKRSDT